MKTQENIQYIALLRGINSGKNPNTKMEVLKKAFEDMGFKNVKTVIASGNVIFGGEDLPNDLLEQRIEESLEKTLGFKSSTIIRRKEEVEELLKAISAKGAVKTPENRLNITFFRNPPKDKNLEEGKGYKVIMINDIAVCYTINPALTRTPDVMSILDKKFGKNITTRTFQTMERILTKF